MFVVDTNVLLYAANAAAPEHERCREALEGWRRRAGAWYLTWSIVYEFLRVATHPRVLPRPWTTDSAWSFVEAVLTSPGLDVLTETDRHADVVAEVLAEVPHAAGNLVHDLHTAVLMREHGIHKIVTRDTDFARFPFVQIVDPVRGDRP